MNKIRIQEMQDKFNKLLQTVPEKNIEFWFARDIQELLGYVRWKLDLILITIFVVSRKWLS